MTVRRTIGGLVAGALLLAGCTSTGVSPGPGPSASSSVPAATAVVQQFVQGLADGDVSKVPIVGSPSEAQTDLTTIMRRMDGFRPAVSAEAPVLDAGAGTGTVQLHQKFTFGSGAWSYDSQAALKLVDGAWQVVWAPTIVHPQLSSATQLRHTRTVPPRASIIGARNLALVEDRTVYRVGLDKMHTPAAKLVSSATALAKLVKIDVNSYVARVKAAGPQQFVEAIVLREGDVPAGVQSIPGGMTIIGTMSLGPTSTFARALLGSTGEADAATVKASKGTILAGDRVGISGLQKTYDAQLRGVPGDTVTLVARAAASASPSASASASPSASDSSSPNATSGPLFTKAPVAGKALHITLDMDAQYRAEEVLSKVKGAAAIVILNPSNGAILAAANSPGANGINIATAGQYAPGSTFKIASSLALLRKGYTPASRVNCPATYTVSGRTFKNFDGYPTGFNGTISLADAVANSCNTAFISQVGNVSGQELKDAAASLGVGIDYPAGFQNFFGSVPVAKESVTRAADLIGQGEVLASPMAMAALAASVQSGKTVVPWLVVGRQPKSSAKPLTASEAASLRTLMQGVVNRGSASSLKGLVSGAKTGTAEFTEGGKLKQHAWLIGWKPGLAIAVLVNDGVSGAKTAAPLAKAYLTAS